MNKGKTALFVTLIAAVIYIIAYILIMYNCSSESDRSAIGVIMCFAFMAYLILSNFIIILSFDSKEDNKKDKYANYDKNIESYDRNTKLKKYAEIRIKELNNYLIVNEREDDDSFFANKEKELFEIAYKALEESERKEENKDEEGRN